MNIDKVDNANKNFFHDAIFIIIIMCDRKNREKLYSHIQDNQQ